MSSQTLARSSLLRIEPWIEPWIALAEYEINIANLWRTVFRDWLRAGEGASVANAPRNERTVQPDSRFEAATVSEAPALRDETKGRGPAKNKAEFNSSKDPAETRSIRRTMADTNGGKRTNHRGPNGPKSRTTAKRVQKQSSQEKAKRSSQAGSKRVRASSKSRRHRRTG